MHCYLNGTKLKGNTAYRRMVQRISALLRGGYNYGIAPGMLVAGGGSGSCLGSMLRP
jgi:hypothetical protein